jgi:hypothetical protein
MLNPDDCRKPLEGGGGFSHMQYQVCGRWETAQTVKALSVALSDQAEQHVYSQLEQRHRDRDDRDHNHGKAADMQVVRPVAGIMNQSHSNLPTDSHDPFIPS